MFEIVKYNKEYESKLMELIKKEGEDWAIYWREPNASIYKKSFEKSITYLVIKNNEVCGYIRSMIDVLFIYVCDLLVNKEYRGNGLGEKLIRKTQSDYPELPIYIMSGNDEYYNKLGCKKEGSIYLFK